MKTPHQRARAAETYRSSFGLEVIRALKGPKHCKTVTIEHKVGYVPTVTYVCQIRDRNKLIRIGEIMKRYRLVKVKAAPLPLP